MKSVCRVALLIVLCTLFPIHVQTKAIEGRIISGTPAVRGQLPWQVILKRNEIDTLLCGASIISDTWVLTAAHCTYGLNSIFLVFGTIALDDTAINMTSTKIFVHPLFNSNNLNNDVSLIQLPKPLNFSSIIQPITLISPLEISNSFIGTRAIIAGFGLMDDEYMDYSEVLLWAQVQIINNSYCIKAFGPDVVKETNLCAKGDGNSNMSICSGDSGGPLVIQSSNGKFVQIGINSFVSEDRCTESYPSGYVRLSLYLDYISKETGLILS